VCLEPLHAEVAPQPRMAKGQEKAPTGPQNHNNEKDFVRRLDAWNKMKADDQEEMTAKVWSGGKA